MDALLILFCAATLIAIEYFVYRDLDSNGAEPWATMALIVLLTPMASPPLDVRSPLATSR